MADQIRLLSSEDQKRLKAAKLSRDVEEVPDVAIQDPVQTLMLKRSSFTMNEGEQKNRCYSAESGSNSGSAPSPDETCLTNRTFSIPHDSELRARPNCNANLTLENLGSLDLNKVSLFTLIPEEEEWISRDSTNTNDIIKEVFRGVNSEMQYNISDSIMKRCGDSDPDDCSVVRQADSCLFCNKNHRDSETQRTAPVLCPGLKGNKTHTLSSDQITDQFLSISGFNLTESDLKQQTRLDMNSGSGDVNCPTVSAVEDRGNSDTMLLVSCFNETSPHETVCEASSVEELSELWVDARPYLLCPEDQILESVTCSQCPLFNPPIDCPDPDNTAPVSCPIRPESLLALWEMPPVESWSSSDSWASALSDWIQSVSLLPEDSTSCKTLSLTGSQHQTCSAVHDTPEEDLISTEGGERLKETKSKKVQAKENIDTNKNVPRNVQRDKQVDPQEKMLMMDYTAERIVHQHADGSKDLTGLWELTEGDSEKEGGRNAGGFSSYPKPDIAEDLNTVSLLRAGCHGLDAHLTSTERESCQSSDTQDSDRTQTVGAVGCVDSVMPLTPVGFRSSFLCCSERHHNTITSLDSLSGTEDGIRSEPPLRLRESDAFLILSPRGILSPKQEEPQDLRSETGAGDGSPGICELILSTNERLMVREERRVACLTLDQKDILSFQKDEKMPHKLQKTSTNNEKSSSRKQEGVKWESNDFKADEVTLMETIIITEHVTPKAHTKKKKKKKHSAAKVKENETPVHVENSVKTAKTNNHEQEATQRPTEQPEAPQRIEVPQEAKAKVSTDMCPQGVLADDIIKRRRISGDRAGSVTVRTRPQLPAIFRLKKEGDIQQGSQHLKDEAPQVLAEIEASPVADDPHSISLGCRFSPIRTECTVTWLKEGTVLSEEKRKVGDERPVSLSVVKASSKDLGLYLCTMSSSLGSASTKDYHLTSEVLMELVIPDHQTSVECREVDGEQEDISCTPLLFKEDFLTDQYFGEQQHTSIVTERTHFGEGMHRKAFRSTLRAGFTPLFNSGHPCVLKVHNSIGYGTDGEELVKKNYNLAVEECYVQNTAREYIKAYTEVAKSAKSFGEVPEIIPIFLVHRPSHTIPYATLEEELMGDFVKYSVKDGKEINLMRRDSEAGQKCCTFQHWVFTQTEGNLLVTDMQGVGMKLTDVGIATCRKGYKGFKGNCSTSFIDQFKALHQCNRFCELLGLTSLQPKPKRTVAPKPKTQTSAKKKPFSPTVKGKS